MLLRGNKYTYTAGPPGNKYTYTCHARRHCDFPVPKPRTRRGHGLVTRAKKKRLEEEEARLADRISNLPDGVLGDIVSLLPTKQGARMQLLSSRWRHVWRSAPLNLDLHKDPVGRDIHANASDISRVLSAHHGPGRRFVMPRRYTSYEELPSTATLDGWLRSPALDNLQELRVRHHVLLQAWVHRFSSTLRVASFHGCNFQDGNNAGSALHLPVLEQMTLFKVSISESSLHALLAGCPILESLLISMSGCPRLQIVSPSLRSIGVEFYLSHHRAAIVIEDAPCLERLLYFGGMKVDISIISAPRLVMLGDLFPNYLGFGCDTTFFQGSTVVSMTAVLPSVKILSLCHVEICLDAAINVVKCFPNLERLYIKAEPPLWLKDVSYLKCQELIHTLDIHVRKIVLVNYKGNKKHINFVKLFVSNSRVLESLRLELADNNVSDVWIARQHKLLHIEKRASRGAQIALVSPNMMICPSDDLLGAEKVHDLSTDPFQRFH